MGRHRNGKRGGQGVRQVVARDASQVEHLGPTRLGRGCRRPPDQGPSARLGDQREHQVTMRVEVVHGDHELAESGLPQVLGEQFRVAPPELDDRRLLQRRGAAQQVPQHVPAARRDRVGPQRGPDGPPPEGAARPAAALVQPGRPQRERGGRREDEQHQPWQPRRQRPGCERGRDEPQVAGHQPSRGAHSDHLQDEIDRIDDETGRDDGQRHGHHGQCRREGPDREAEERVPAVERRHGRDAPEAAVVPEPMRPVHRGEERADRADAAARHDVHLHAGFGERPQHAGVVRAGGAGAREHQRSPELWRIGVGGRCGIGRLDHSLASSWMVVSVRISNSRSPPASSR